MTSPRESMKALGWIMLTYSTGQKRAKKKGKTPNGDYCNQNTNQAEMEFVFKLY